MIDREQYAPGLASGARVRKAGEKWTLMLVRELRHSERLTARWASPFRGSYIWNF